MYTRTTLRGISLAEYDRLKNLWGFPKKFKETEVFAEIVNPIQSTSYEDLFGFLAGLPHHGRLHVREGTNWRKVPTHKLDGRVIKELADIARGDRLKVNYLEMKFEGRPHNYSAEIEFIERNGIITGYRIEVFVPRMNYFSDLFDYRVAVHPNTRNIRAVSNPKNPAQPINAQGDLGATIAAMTLFGGH